MKRWLIGVAGLLALTTSSCAVSWFNATPKEVIQQAVVCSTDSSTKAQNVQVISTHRWSQGVIVLYSALCPDGRKSSLKSVFGHKVVKRSGINWQVSGSDNYGTEDTIYTLSKPSEQLVEYGISQSLNQRDRYTILYGRALKKRVVAIEATFDNGKILRSENVNGVFALISPSATGICELRIFGADNQILRQEDLAALRKFLKKPSPSQCLPTSHTL